MLDTDFELHVKVTGAGCPNVYDTHYVNYDDGTGPPLRPERYGEPAVIANIPKQFALEQNHPNPFNPSTTISFQLPQTDGLQTISAVLRIYYDVRGRLVKSLVDESLLPGSYSVHWDGTNNEGEEVSSGTYFYTFIAGNFRETKKMIILK